MAIIVDPYSGEVYTVPDVTPTAEELRKITVPNLTALYEGRYYNVSPSTPSLTGGTNVSVPQPAPVIPVETPKSSDPWKAPQWMVDSDNFLRNVPLFGWLYNMSSTSFGLNKNATPASQGQYPSGSMENFQFMGYSGMTAILILLMLTGGI